MTYRHILVAIDMNEPNDATLSRAAQVSEQQGAMLTVLTIFPEVQAMFAGTDAALEPDFERRMVREGLVRLREYVGKRVPNVALHSVNCRGLVGSPETSITSYAERHECDLIILGAHDRHGLEYFLGTIASAVLYRANCDVLGVRDSHDVAPYQSVLVAIDGGLQSLDILAAAADFIQARQHVSVVSVVRPIGLDYPVEGVEGMPQDMPQAMMDIEARWLDQLKRLLKRSELHTKHLDVVYGKPSTELKKLAKEKSADVVVMGSGDRHGPGWMIGSTTHNVLHGVNCDVLVIRQQQSAA